MVSEKQKKHLEQIRNNRSKIATAKKIEELTKKTEDDELRNILLQKAKEAYKKEIFKKEDEYKKNTTKPEEDLQEQLKILKAEIDALKSKNEDVVDDEEEVVDDLDEEDVEDLKEDLEDELEDLLDEEEQDIFNLLNRLHELQIIQIKQEYEKIIEELHKEYEQKERHMNSIKNRLHNHFNTIVEKEKVDKDIGFQNYFQRRLNAYHSAYGENMNEKLMECIKNSCLENYYKKSKK